MLTQQAKMKLSLNSSCVVMVVIITADQTSLPGTGRHTLGNWGLMCKHKVISIEWSTTETMGTEIVFQHELGCHLLHKMSSTINNF